MEWNLTSTRWPESSSLAAALWDFGVLGLKDWSSAVIGPGVTFTPLQRNSIGWYTLHLTGGVMKLMVTGDSSPLGPVATKPGWDSSSFQLLKCCCGLGAAPLLR